MQMFEGGVLKPSGSILLTEKKKKEDKVQKKYVLVCKLQIIKK